MNIDIRMAFIAMFVLDLGGSVGEEANAGVEIDDDGTVTWISEGNADSINVGGTECATSVGEDCTGEEGDAVIAVSGDTETQIGTVEISGNGGDGNA